MKTKVYGISDDLVEVETEQNIYPYDEIGCFDSMVRILFTDNTVIEVEYGKDGKGIWKIEVTHKGDAKQKLTICNDEDADIYSDIFEIDADFDKCTVI